MPLLTFDLVSGRTAAEVTELLDAAQEAVVEAFGVPERDRYQIVNEHEAGRFVVQDTGLGIERTDRVVLVQITSRPRSKEQKQDLYRLLTEKWQQRCGIEPSDVVVAVTENTDEDWSFGHGRAQFLTGEL